MRLITQMLLASVSFALILVSVAECQPPEASLSFEVASVKPASPGRRPGDLAFLTGPAAEAMHFRGGPGTSEPGRINYLGVTLKMLIKRAYDLKSEQISGPSWLDSEKYDIAAVLPPSTTAAQFRQMLQNLLEERFRIAFHRETRTLAIYSLTTVKRGANFHPPEIVPTYDNEEERKAAMIKRASESLSKISAEHTTSRFFHLPNATMAEFATRLSANLDNQVVDNTHIDGRYAFTLKWVPDGAGSVGDVSTGPSIFAALEEQLGLKLVRGKADLEVLVIDHADKSPTSN